MLDWQEVENERECILALDDNADGEPEDVGLAEEELTG